MRHQMKKVTLDRMAAPRKALLANLAESLIFYEKIKTTKAKARAVRPLVEKYITIAKANNLTARRRLLAELYTANAVKKLLEDLAPRYKDKKGGYTRIVALKNRLGDGAVEAIIEFVK